MTPSEFLAMLDVRLSDGRRYPTIDEYTQALADVRERERRADRERRHVPDLTDSHQHVVEPPPVIRPVGRVPTVREQFNVGASGSVRLDQSFQVGSGAVRLDQRAQRQARDEYEAVRGQAAAPASDWFARHTPPAGWVVQFFTQGWHTVQAGRFTTPAEAQRIVTRMRVAQGHLAFRLFNEQTGEVLAV